MIVTKRDIAISIILSIFTCGIYSIIWFIELNDDVKRVSGDTTMPSGGVAFLLSLVTCGIYGLYWAYKMGELMKVAETTNNLPLKDNSLIYILLNLFGLSIVTYALIQSELNTIADQRTA